MSILDDWDDAEEVDYATDPAWNCVDCGIHTGLHEEYYMVHDSVWKLSGLGDHDGMLCIACLEDRIGRDLTPDDFPVLPINSGNFFSALLLARLGRVPS